jgi:hypothetical protein
MNNSKERLDVVATRTGYDVPPGKTMYLMIGGFSMIVEIIIPDNISLYLENQRRNL